MKSVFVRGVRRVEYCNLGFRNSDPNFLRRKHMRQQAKVTSGMRSTGRYVENKVWFATGSEILEAYKKAHA